MKKLSKSQPVQAPKECSQSLNLEEALKAILKTVSDVQAVLPTPKNLAEREATIRDILRRTEELTPAYQNQLHPPEEPKRYEIQVGGVAAGKTMRAKMASMASKANFFRHFDYWIGIDGGTDTGVACWEPKNKAFAWIKTLSFWDVIDFLSMPRTIAKRSQTCLVIEDPALNLSINAGKRSGNPLVMGKIGQNVGSVKRETQLLIDFFKRNGWQYITVRPTNSKTKNAEYFGKLTGYKERTNQHERDAALLVFGK